MKNRKLQSDQNLSQEEIDQHNQKAAEIRSQIESAVAEAIADFAKLIRNVSSFTMREFLKKSEEQIIREAEKILKERSFEVASSMIRFEYYAQIARKYPLKPGESDPMVETAKGILEERNARHERLGFVDKLSPDRFVISLRKGAMRCDEQSPPKFIPAHDYESSDLNMRTLKLSPVKKAHDPDRVHARSHGFAISKEGMVLDMLCQSFADGMPYTVKLRIISPSDKKKLDAIEAEIEKLRKRLKSATKRAAERGRPASIIDVQSLEEAKKIEKKNARNAAWLKKQVSQ